MEKHAKEIGVRSLYFSFNSSSLTENVKFYLNTGDMVRPMAVTDVGLLFAFKCLQAVISLKVREQVNDLVTEEHFWLHLFMEK